MNDDPDDGPFALHDAVLALRKSRQPTKTVRVLDDEQARQEFEAVAREQWTWLDLSWGSEGPCQGYVSDETYTKWTAWLEATKRSAARQVEILMVPMDDLQACAMALLAAEATITTLTTRNAALTEAVERIAQDTEGDQHGIWPSFMAEIAKKAIANDPRCDCYGTPLAPIAESDGALYAAKEPQP